MTKPKRPPGWMTAAEHRAWLREAGQYEAFVDRQRQQDEERQKRAAEWRRAEAPLVEELRNAGYSVESVWDLVNTPGSYPTAVPILLAHLSRPYPGRVREGIARALAVPEAKSEGWETLTRLFREEQEEQAKDGLAVAIAGAADDEVIDEVIALARDESLGASRVILLHALEHSRDRRARAALMEFGAHPNLGAESRAILRRLKRRTKK